MQPGFQGATTPEPSMMLRMHCWQQFYNVSGPSVGEFCETESSKRFLGLDSRT